MHPHAKHLQELMQTRADLHPDLVPYLERAQRSSTIMLRHPLVYEMFYMPSLNALINHRYEMKMHSITEAREKKDFPLIVALHERPYRMQALIECIDAGLDGQMYWELLRDVYVDIENCWQYVGIFPTLFHSTRPGKQFLMTPEEADDLLSLPRVITVYRGGTSDGWSWTLGEERAVWFATRYRTKSEPVWRAQVLRDNVTALILGRSEDEIVVDPQFLFDVKQIRSGSVRRNRT